jgi:polyisoprenoid-binding protein YceI
MLKKSVMSMFIIVLFLGSSGFSQGTNYIVDKNHTGIGFSVTHMLIAKVRGEFKEYDINFVFDENDLSKSSVSATIKVSSINTEIERRDGHLKSPDFFDAANHPDMTFESTRIEKKDGGYVAHGKLTIRETTKEVALPFIIKGPVKDGQGKTRIGVEANLTINRFDYGLNWNNALEAGGLVVSEDVNIEINAEFTAQ